MNPIQHISQLVSDDLTAVNQLILQSLHSDIALIELIGKRIIDSGGKRIRPLLIIRRRLTPSVLKKRAR